MQTSTEPVKLAVVVRSKYSGGSPSMRPKGWGGPVSLIVTLVMPLVVTWAKPTEIGGSGTGTLFPSSEAGYDEADASDYAYYEDYPEETGRNWTLIGLGCILIAIILILLVAILVYFFAPASIVDPIADFLAGLGINVP